MIGLVIACESEALPLIKRIDVKSDEIICNKRVVKGIAYGKEVVLIISRVGKVNAGIATQLLIDRFGVDTIINFGVAGGLTEEIELFGTYQIMRVCQYDFDLTELDHCQMGKLCEFDDRYLQLTKDYFGFDYATVGTGDRFNDSVDDYNLLVNDIKADIREMELGAIVQTCLHAGVKCYSFKSISDKPGNSVGQFELNVKTACEKLGEAFDKVFSILKDVK